MPLTRQAEAVARHFHEVYEQLAPAYNYRTRPESSVPWENVPSNNRNLMIAVAKELLDRDIIQVGEHLTVAP